MNSAYRSVQREARAGATFVARGRTSRLSDSNVAHSLKLLINDTVVVTTDSRRRSRQAYQVTLKILKQLQDEKDRGSAIGSMAFTTAMWGLMKHGLPRAVPRLFKHAQANKIDVGIMGWNCLAGAYAAAGNTRLMWSTIEKMRDDGLEPTTYTYNTCIGQCARVGGDVQKECFRLFKDMVDNGVAPDTHSWVRIISACDTVNHAHDVLQAMMRQQNASYIHYNALLSVCMRCGDAASAEFFFNSMLTAREKDCRPNTITYTTLMSLYRDKDDFDGVVEVYARMRKYAITPNAATYIVFISACGAMASRDSTEDPLKYVDVAVAAFKQALAEGLDETSLIATAARFLAKHKPAAMADVREYMVELEIDVPVVFDDAWRDASTTDS